MRRAHWLAFSNGSSFPCPTGVCKGSFDSVVSYPWNGHTYIFNGTDYWRINGVTGTLDLGYPLKITENWKGVPNSIDEVFAWGNNWNIYFFKVHT